MLNTKKGKPVAMLQGGDNDGKVICIDENSKDGYDEIELHEEGKVKPLMDFISERGVYYIAGPSGSGKSTYVINLIKDYLKMFPETEFYVFSRTDAKSDPAYAGIRIHQIKIDESLLQNPIDIEKEVGDRSILLFDDCGTIQNDELKRYIEKLMCDVMEIGRRLHINIIITNHLINPSSKAFARCVMNELQFFTFFPRSGATYQINYCLKHYFGLSKPQIDKIMNLPSRWVTISKKYPLCVISEKDIYIL